MNTKFAILLYVLFFLFSFTLAQDPADSWLAYAVAKGNGKRITFINATWIVPDYPQEKQGGNAPGWWFGIEPYPAMNLIQPILAWGEYSPQYTIFNGYYQWDNSYWWQSDTGAVSPGNHIYAWVKYVSSNDSYTMYIGCKETGWSITNNIACEDGKIFTDAYFVVEHQPDDCGQYPSNGQLTFYDINIELDDSPVVPKWSAQQYEPACDSQGYVVDPSTLKFTWDPNGSISKK